MKTKLMAAVVAAMFVGALHADLTVYTEKVDGWTWQYEISEGKAHNVVGQFASKYFKKPGPNLVIPAKLGGKAVASLGVYALQGYDFTAVTIPSTVTYIGYRAFGDCRYLKSVKLPDSMKTVAYYAFEGCVNLQCVDFGKNVSFIGVKAFNGCSSLRSLVFRGANAPKVDVDQHTGAPSSFDGVAEGCTVYVPAKAKDWPTGQWQGMPLVAGDCLVKVNVDVYDGGGEHGTVSGGGIFAVGKKITIKGTPNKGCLCAGWLDEATGVYYGHSASISYVVTGADTDFRTGFVQSNATEDYLYVDSLYSQYDADDDSTVYVPVGVSSLSEPKVTVKGLPSGVKFDAAKMVLTGKATKPGLYPVSVSATNKSIKEPRTAQFDLYVPNFKDELIELDDMYGWCLPGAVYVETIDKAAGCKVAGLPSGLKWTDKAIVDKDCGPVPANSIYGAPAKPGYYTVFFTKTDDSKVKHTATATFFVLPFKKVEVEMVGNSGKDKATGAGEYAVGKKITLKATADKDRVFGGWYYDSECTSAGFVSFSPSFQFEMPLVGEVKFYAKFITAEEDAAGVSAVLDGAFSYYPGMTEYATETPAGVYLEWPLEVTAKSQTTVAVSGLPSGLKFTAKDIVDSKTKLVTIPANTIYGVPTAASKTDMNTGMQIPSNVKITITTAGKTKVEYTLALTVTPMAAWAVGTFAGAVFDDGDNVVGQVQSIAVSSVGKISGKIIDGDATWTVSAPSFDQYSAGKYTATVTLKSDATEITDEVEFSDGIAMASDWKAWRNVWKDADRNEEAKTLKNLKIGPAREDTVTFSAPTQTGSVTAKLKDGSYSASMSTTLIPVESGYMLFWYFPPKAGKFAGDGGCETVK